MAAVTDAERITRRETRLAEILAEKEELQATGPITSGTTRDRDYTQLMRQEAQIRAELAELRTR
jgi:hypothetical protein